jgi:hypothetical protein
MPSAARVAVEVLLLMPVLVEHPLQGSDVAPGESVGC